MPRRKVMMLEEVLAVYRERARKPPASAGG
jgi:hypothetical protein